MSSITTRRQRILAASAAAILIIPIALGAALTIDRANAAGVLQDPNAPLRSYADIVAADKPAVVTITTKMKAPDSGDDQQMLGQGFPNDDFFRQFFGDNSPFGQMPRQRPQGGQTAEALGSGFIVSPEGMIVTNNHVIDGATEIKVTLDSGKEYTGKLLGHDPKTDLAVVKIDATGLPTVAWGDSDKLRAGDPVLAMGNPFGIGTTVTSGIVSARGRDLHNGPYDDFIQVDAAINHGNSGGPLVDSQGQVVGINTAIYSPNGGNVGVGFAIPSDQAQAVVAKLEKGTTIEHGYIGVQIQPVDQDVANALGMKDQAGALVAQVVDGSPAAKAGIKTGDVITEFGGKTVASPKDLSRIVADMTPGEKADVGVWRQGKLVDLSVAVSRSKDGQQASANQKDQAQPGDALSVPDLGMQLGELTPRMRDRFGIDQSVQGAIITHVNDNKPAADVGLQPGDVVLSVNQKEATTAEDVVAAVKAAEKDGRRSVLLGIERGESQMYVGVPFGNA